MKPFDFFSTLDITPALSIVSGDVTIAVVDLGSNGDSCWLVLAVSDEGEGELAELLREEFSEQNDAIARALRFAADEYELGAI